MIKLIEIALKVLLTPLTGVDTSIRLVSALVLWDGKFMEGDWLMDKIWKKQKQ